MSGKEGLHRLLVGGRPDCSCTEEEEEEEEDLLLSATDCLSLLSSCVSTNRTLRTLFSLFHSGL